MWMHVLLASPVGPGGVAALAQSPEAVGDATRRVLVALAALIGAIALVVVVALLLRRWVLKPPDQLGSRGFTLSDLRRLHEQGELSDEEWEAARQAMLARGKRDLLGDDDANPPDEAPNVPKNPPPTSPSQ